MHTHRTRHRSIGYTASNSFVRERVNDELKAFATAIKDKKTVSEAAIKAVSEKICNGYGFRFVPATITTGYDSGLVTFCSDDTGEVYHQRPLNTEERQFVMDLKADYNGI